MTAYRFELRLTGNVEAAVDALYEAGWNDAGVSCDATSGSAEFVREAGSAIEAITSAIEQAEACGLEVTGVTEDLVTLSEIAERTDRTLASVDHWVRGRRGPGGFPPPRVARSRASLYSWTDVTTWLSGHDVVDLDVSVREVARACALVDAALRTRQGLRALPQEHRELVARLVA